MKILWQFIVLTNSHIKKKSWLSDITKKKKKKANEPCKLNKLNKNVTTTIVLLIYTFIMKVLWKCYEHNIFLILKSFYLTILPSLQKIEVE